MIGSMQIVPVAFGLISWFIIAFLTVRLYKKKENQQKIWKVILTVYIGIFAFTFNLNMLGTMIKIPILPLGVWIMYFVLKRKEGRWKKYRSFAWLGFGANVIFLITTLLSVPVQKTLYPEQKVATYLSNIEGASLIPIHPSATDQVINYNSLNEQLSIMKLESIYNEEWYEETYMGEETNETNETKERFPYLLTGTQSKWGSGITPAIYIESDGKGLLVSMPDKKIYFQAKESFLGEGN